MFVEWITFTILTMIMKHITRIVLSASLALWTISCNETRSPEEQSPQAARSAPAQDESAAVPAAPTAPPAVAADRNRLAGTWERTDAPYQLVISGIAEDGTLTAAYLNPNPIKVSKANWVDAKDVISVFVELRDVNYPGSNYTLTYFPDRDMLIGKYFQAVQGMTYDVVFARAK
jgi:hypothetical protein